MDFLQFLFSTDGFPPRWHCGVGWQQMPQLGWLHILSDIGVWSAYTAIPCLLAYFISRRRDLPFNRIFWLFCTFIFACGTTHLLEAFIFWWPGYPLLGLFKLITAVVSWATVIAMVPLVPQMLRLRSPAELEKEIIERQKAERQLKELADSQEEIIAQRTADLAERSRQLEAINRELEAFSYSISHDLKSPVNRIASFCQLLERRYGEQLDEQGNDYLQRIIHNATQMSGLIEDLLSLSRLNRKALSRESVDLAAMARQIVDDLRLQTPEHPADLVIPDRLTAWGDPSLLLSVMQNLLGNAWKYSSKQPQTRIEVGSRREGRQTVYFVKDNGIGFPMDQADKIFAPFHRLQNKADYPGTGIGLANVQRIIHRHNGKVWAESQPNAGATFFFTLGDATSPVPMTEASLAMPSAEPA